MPPNFNPDFYMKSIYSFPLNEEMQSDKLFALEAMHDLRPDMEWNSIKGALKIAAENAKRDILGLDQSYYKRAIRSNELFFIVPVSDIYSERKLELICGVNHIIDSPLVFYDLHN